MKNELLDFWTDETSVLFTSFWGWTPETWGAIGWTGDRGRARRDNLLKDLSDPFITVCYVTSNKTFSDPDLKGMLAGFYLVSHETCDRDEFTHPIHYNLSPEKWRHSLRAMRAFTYLPEYRPSLLDYDPTAPARARTIAAMGELVTDPQRIALLRDTPSRGVEIYSGSPIQTLRPVEAKTSPGFVRGGPASQSGYTVEYGTAGLPRRLYILKLNGDTSAYLGEDAGERAIYKIGLAVSPETRRQQFQKSMPKGSFVWELIHSSIVDNDGVNFSFDAASAGEDAMKLHLAKHAEHLNGEFYLASRLRPHGKRGSGSLAITKRTAPRVRAGGAVFF